MKMHKNIQNKTKLQKRKELKHKGLQCAILHIRGGSNNTIMNLTTETGDTITHTSCGKDFKNSKKSTPYATQSTLSNMLNKTRELGINTLKVVIKTHGPTNVRDSLSELGNSGLRIMLICDKTSSPHNGCRPPKAPKK